MRDTKDRILDAAERLFAEQGFDGASLRAITSSARVNLAAVNYHFNSKEALLQSVFARKLAPLNRKRLALLDALEAEAGLSPVPVEKLVHALVEPVVRLLEKPAEGSMSFGMLLGRMYTTPTPSTRGIFLGEIRGLARRFSAAFLRSLPGLPFEEVAWRIFFGIGAMSQILAAGWMLPIISEGKVDISDVDGIVDRLTCFFAAGLRARPVQPQSRNGRRRRLAGRRRASH
jgi:AcrR family transcriptional regulator